MKLEKIAAEAYREGLNKRGYAMCEWDDLSATLKTDILSASKDSVDAVLEELGLWTHDDFPGWVAFDDSDEPDNFYIRNKNYLEGMPLLRKVDEGVWDTGPSAEFAQVYLEAHPYEKQCPSNTVLFDHSLRCELEEDHMGSHLALVPSSKSEVRW